MNEYIHTAMNRDNCITRIMTAGNGRCDGKIGRKKAKDALANIIGVTINGLGPSGYPSVQMLATNLICDKRRLLSTTGLLLGFGAFLEIADELT